MKRILIPTDFSEAANNALQIAISVAKQVGAEISLLHSLNSAQQYVDISLSTAGDITMPGMQPDVVVAAIEQAKERAIEKMEALAKKVSAENIPVHTELLHPALEHVINEFVDENKIDFIIMGTYGSSGIREAFIGSNAQKIVRICRIPVLTVNNSCNDFNINKMVCCSDFIEEPILEQLPRIKAFAEVFNAHLELVYINTPTYFEETKTVNQRMNDVVSQYGLDGTSTHIYNAFDIDEGVINFAEEQGADVIAMITHGYRGLKKMFSDNITESVVNHSSIPVLTLHLPG